MKKIAILISIATVVLSNNHALAGEHGAHCLNMLSGEMKNCRVIVSELNNSLEMNFKSDKLQDVNMKLKGNQITEISTGEYAKKRTKETIGASLVLGPLGALVGLFAKQDRTQLAIEYVDYQNNKNVTMIDIPTKHSEPLMKDLESLTGLQIRNTEGTGNSE
ncbi:MAG: hypothetical protein F6K54_38530 [Okeania sp. SIO3B5]|uniref:hypothetical protein n=1 Tax=Okeania sp. SIO3B5 TaxID=2607811 RepID=UPI001401984A|nr:hypothetical protein [Okeania sp. SIO3B5]NEO58436.1 hypothetical protein [Okeania sp. SIO3B5]